MNMKGKQGQIKTYIQPIIEIKKNGGMLPAYFFDFSYYRMECSICMSNNTIIVYHTA